MKPALPSCVVVVGLGYVGLPLAVAFPLAKPFLPSDSMWTRSEYVNFKTATTEMVKRTVKN